MGLHDGHRKRLRERYRKEGLEHFEDHNCLELLLFYSIPQRDTNPIAHNLLSHFGSLTNVFSASVEELCKVEGITENSAVLISMIPKLMSKVDRTEFKQESMNSAKILCDYCKTLFYGETEERLKILCLDSKLRVVACEEVAKGTSGRIDFNIRSIIEIAFKHKTDVLVMTHNHPRTNSLPSNADLSATNRVKATLEGIGIKLLDHIIVGEKEVTSLKDGGFLFDL